MFVKELLGIEEELLGIEEDNTQSKLEEYFKQITSNQTIDIHSKIENSRKLQRDLLLENNPNEINKMIYYIDNNFPEISYLTFYKLLSTPDEYYENERTALINMYYDDITSNENFNTSSNDNKDLLFYDLYYIYIKKHMRDWDYNITSIQEDNACNKYLKEIHTDIKQVCEFKSEKNVVDILKDIYDNCKKTLSYYNFNIILNEYLYDEISAENDLDNENTSYLNEVNNALNEDGYKDVVPINNFNESNQMEDKTLPTISNSGQSGGGFFNKKNKVGPMPNPKRHPLVILLDEVINCPNLGYSNIALGRIFKYYHIKRKLIKYNTILKIDKPKNNIKSIYDYETGSVLCNNNNKFIFLRNILTQSIRNNIDVFSYEKDDYKIVTYSVYSRTYTRKHLSYKPIKNNYNPHINIINQLKLIAYMLTQKEYMLTKKKIEINNIEQYNYLKNYNNSSIENEDDYDVNQISDEVLSDFSDKFDFNVPIIDKEILSKLNKRYIDIKVKDPYNSNGNKKDKISINLNLLKEEVEEDE